MNNAANRKENPMKRIESALFCILAIVAVIAVGRSVASLTSTPTWNVVDSARAGTTRIVEAASPNTQAAETTPNLLVAQSR